MKKKIICFLAFLLLISVPVSVATTFVNIMNVGDSISDGTCGNPGVGYLTQYLTSSGHGSWSYYQGGVGGQRASGTYSSILTYWNNYTAALCLLHVGINDIAVQDDMTTEWLANLTNIQTSCTAHSASLIVNQMLPLGPDTYARPDYNTVQANEPIWLANLDEWGFLHQIPVSRLYREFINPAADARMNPTYICGDGLNVHPTLAGYNLIGYLMSFAAVPTRSYDYGNASYPGTNHGSWSDWLLSGSTSIVGGTTDSFTGKKNQGVLTLNNGDYAVSDVFAIIPNSNSIAIIPIIIQGNPSFYYRTLSTEFAQSASTASTPAPVNNGAWTAYSGVFNLTSGTPIFIQLKVVNNNATQAQISQASLKWNGTYSISGTVSGAVQSGVTVNLTGTSSASTTTASDGTYSFTGLSAGSYTITPGKTGYTFSPTTFSPIITTANITGGNFTASAVVASSSSGVAGSFSGTVQ
jgi:hypothetical protein